MYVYGYISDHLNPLAIRTTILYDFRPHSNEFEYARETA